MTSKPGSDALVRAHLVALLAEAPNSPNRSPHRGGYPIDPAAERTWSRASEQERRRMLKDCGWL